MSYIVQQLKDRGMTPAERMALEQVGFFKAYKTAQECIVRYRLVRSRIEHAKEQGQKIIYKSGRALGSVEYFKTQWQLRIQIGRVAGGHAAFIAVDGISPEIGTKLFESKFAGTTFSFYPPITITKTEM